MGAGWCLEAVSEDTHVVASRHHFDSWQLVHLIQDLESEADLPEDASLAWCDPIDPEMAQIDENESGAEEIPVWSVPDITPGLRWLRELVEAKDPRAVSTRDIERGEDKYLLAEINEALSWLDRVGAKYSVRCIATQ
jgi:hypothetical protein